MTEKCAISPPRMIPVLLVIIAGLGIITPACALMPNPGWVLANYTVTQPDCTIPLNISGGPDEPLPGCDNYTLDLYERPTASDPKPNDPGSYYSYIDIEWFKLGEDNEFYYLAIKMVEEDQNGDLSEFYMFEFDFDKDYRGDFLMNVKSPYDPLHLAGWTNKSLYIHQDTDNFVGRNLPQLPDPNGQDGYDQKYWEGEAGFGSPSDLAWVRVKSIPFDPSIVEFALKKGEIGNA